jgi:hypothetical protein
MRLRRWHLTHQHTMTRPESVLAYDNQISWEKVVSTRKVDVEKMTPSIAHIQEIYLLVVGAVGKTGIHDTVDTLMPVNPN